MNSLLIGGKTETGRSTLKPRKDADEGSLMPYSQFKSLEYAYCRADIKDLLLIKKISLFVLI